MVAAVRDHRSTRTSCVHRVGAARANASDKHSAPEVKECIVVVVGLCYMRTCNYTSVVQRVSGTHNGRGSPHLHTT